MLKNRFYILWLLIGLTFALPQANVFAGEHPGEEHAGKPAKKEDPGEEHAGKTAPKFSAEQIKKAMRAHIDAQTKNGVFAIYDRKTKKDLKLRFVKIHEPVREMQGKGFFACTDFVVVKETGELEAGKLYDLDFWLNPRDGKLVVTETKIHKEPKKINGQWTKQARYTFINDKPVVVP